MSETTNESSLKSVHTSGFTNLLKHYGISVAITTYQAGKLILARVEDDVTNTHFAAFNKPMGMAANADRLTLGTTAQLLDFRNVPSAANKTSVGKHDACFVLRETHVTGDIDIHEMDWVDDELWFINTRFSCLCTFDPQFSFVPQWKPPFITQYDMRDRCHLNGFCLRDKKPRYVTALGQSDEAGGWRKRKANGGILMDIQSNEILLEGLSMPHSPRWYRDNLYFLESGCGTLNRYDESTGESEIIAEFPGFTRGIDFVDHYAIVGLSQIRETATFSGLPLTQTQPVRHSGIWVVDLNDGEIKAFLRFEADVQEIFAVSVLPWNFPDVINDDLSKIASTYVLPEEVLKDTVQPSDDWEFAETHFERGNSLFNECKVEESITAYKQCLNLMPDYLPARYNVGIALSNLKRYDEAIIQLEKVIAAEAGHVDALNSLGFIHSELGDKTLSKSYFKEALAINPNFTQAKDNLKSVS